MKQKIKTIKLFIAIAYGLFCGIFGWQFGAHCAVEPQVEKRIPALEDIQKMVGAKPDGIYGKETQEKWDEAICSQYAKDMWPK